MNKEFLASTSVFAEMANNNVDLSKIINEFIINTYILNNTYSQNSAEIKNELVKHFDIDVPEAIVRTQLKRLKREEVLDQTDGQFIINPNHRQARQYISESVDEKKDVQNKIFEQLSDYVKFQNGPLSDKEKEILQGSFIEYLFDNTIEDKYSTLISAFIVKNETDSSFLKELNLIREGATILKGIYYTTDFNDTNVWRTPLTIYLDTEHLLSLSGLNGETFELMLMDFFNLVRDVNGKTQSAGQKLIKLRYTSTIKNEIENLFHVAKRIVEGKATLRPGKTAIKRIADGCSQTSDITRKISEFFTKLKNMGVLEAEDIELLEYPEFNVVDEKALIKYEGEKDSNEINKILEEFTYINIMRKGQNNRGFEHIGHILMTGDRVTRAMSFDNELKVTGSDFSFATDVYYVTQRLWYKLNRGLGFNNPLPSTLNVVNKARVIISSQINSSVRKRFNDIEKEIASGARTSEELKEYYLRLRANTSSPESITLDSLEEKIDFIYDDDDLENYLRNRSAEQSILADRKAKVEALKTETLNKEAENKRMRELLISNSLINAQKSHKLYRTIAKFIIGIIVLLVAFLGYILKQETDSTLSVIAYVFSGISIIISLISWRKINNYLETKAYSKHLELTETENLNN